jgi:hypothetical protein
VSWVHRPQVHLAAVFTAVLAAHLLTARHSEPFFNNDEIRHTATGVFFADAIRDLPASATDPKGYSVRYYCQYPVLGLVTWPPLFYAVEGVVMLALGPHFWVGRLCVAAFALLGGVYTYRFARLMLSHPFALLATAFTTLTPVVFVFSQRVMLEVPTFALALAAVVHFEKHLHTQRGRDAILACLLAAGAVLTRFDGVFLLPYFGLRILRTWNFRLLWRWPVVAGVLIAAILTVPYYWLTITLYGTGLGTSVTAGTDPNAPDIWPPVFYLATLSEQAGGGLAVVAVSGLLLTIACHRKESGPAFGLAVAVFVTFTPLAEQDARHAIYWLPAVAVFAVRPVQWVWVRGWKWAASVGVLGLFVWAGSHLNHLPYRYVFGYSDAMTWVTDHRATDRPLLVDGELAGSFVYHTRVQDPSRRVWVLRADKVLYNQFSDPSTGYRQYASTEAEVLALIEKWDPEFVVVEDPQPAFHHVEGSELLRRTLKNNCGEGKAFAVVERIPIRTNYDKFLEPGAALVIYRKLHRNPAASNDVQMELVGLGRTVGTSRP